MPCSINSPRLQDSLDELGRIGAFNSEHEGIRGVRRMALSNEDAAGRRHRRIPAGAGHDAQEWSRLCPTGMIFVPGENDGISHNPLEFSTPVQCANGIIVLLHTILNLAELPS